ncbi:hypothetical protein [Halopseudomonas sabulinigri]
MVEWKRYDRQQLLDDVWSTPVSRLTKHYGLSDAGLKKLCSRLQIKTPPRGYWAKLRAGKKVPAKPLLSEYSGSPLNLNVLVRKRKQGYLPPSADMDPRLATVVHRESEPANKIVVPARLNNPHPFVKITQSALAEAALDQREQPATSGRLIHLKVSKPMQARALRVANTLLKAVEKRGYETLLDDRGVALVFHGLKYHFELYETCSRVKYEMTEADERRRQRGQYVFIPTWTFVPSGVLALQTRGGYGPKIMDGKRKRVEDLLNAFLIRVATDGVADLLRDEAHAEKKAEFTRQHEAWMTRKAKQNQELDKLKTLEDDAVRWQRAERLRQYLCAMSKAPVSSDELATKKQAVVDWGYAKADWLDPLVKLEDEVLDEELTEPRWMGF